MKQFVHFHVHTQYSILDGASNIKELVKKAVEYKMPAVAVTDHGNLFGIKEFLNEVNKHNKSENDKAASEEKKGNKYEPRLLKAVVGCEMYLARRSMKDKEKEIKDDKSGNHLIVLAKNIKGYKNLIKLSSKAYIEGFYSKPRIDKPLLFAHKEGLIVTTACIAGEIPRAIREGNIEAAEKAALQFREEFGEDFYFEVMRHHTTDPEADLSVYPEQEKVNKALVELSEKTGIKIIATNDVHFINKEDAEAHDRLICINTNSQIDDVKRLRYTKQEWFKSAAEMCEIFSDIPEAIDNTMEIARKIEEYTIDKPPVMPEFPIPEEFGSMESYHNKITEADLIKEFGEKKYYLLGGYEKVLRIKLEADYLEHLVMKGAEQRFGTGLEEHILERLKFELETIRNMGYPGYFLIVSDFIAQARMMDIWVGPGRGSAAGSAVSYCLKITDLDPFKYDLLFERFLNPERISMPDIDIDFDEDGRNRILKWVVEKYGKNNVANVITFGKMACRSAIRDVARVQRLPLKEADRLAKLIPEEADMSLPKAFSNVTELKNELTSGTNEVITTLRFAETLEGSVRQTGIHACGVIICKDPIIEHVPVCTSKETDLLVTQYDGHYLESVGMMKMDFLGLKTLSILKDAVENIEKNKEIKISINNIPLDDKKTYELFSKGLTIGVFQFESEGMQKYLRELKPNQFKDLIAMNALYRPGPMDFIPKYINRKQGKEQVSYELPVMDEILKDTYGITVYQEQVMLLSQKLAGFTKGDADSLRKAMGKKELEGYDKMKELFLEGCQTNGFPQRTCEKIWNEWRAFASYAFNKSHSTCYAFLAYQTAFLKAHFPEEFMAACLSRNLKDIKEITKFMDGCKQLKINVLGPDVNESRIHFSNNKKGDLRFGLGGIKGMGEAVAEAIINERENAGNYKNIFDFTERVNPNVVNKRCMEALAYSGAFDSFSEVKRYQYFAGNETTFIENLLKYGNKFQSDTGVMQQSLFGESVKVEIKLPEIPAGEEWSTLYMLEKEKEHTGIYLSSHPLDAYRFDIENFTTHAISELKDLAPLENKEVTFAGFVTSVQTKTTKTGNPYSTSVIEDYSDSYRFSLFGKDYVEFSKYMHVGMCLLIKAKVQKNTWKEKNNDIELRINKIKLLTDVRSEIRKVIIRVNLSSVDQKFTAGIESICKKNKGKTLLILNIVDDEKLSIDMFSKKFSVNLTNGLINYFLENDIEFKIQ